MKTQHSILTAILALFFFSCEKIYEHKTYYDVIGAGYIYDGTNNVPLKGASITVYSGFSGGELIGTPTAEETYYTNANGYYEIRFIKRTHNDKVAKYTFRVDYSSPSPPPPYWYKEIQDGKFPYISFSDADIKQMQKKGKNLLFDTIKYYQDYNYKTH